MNSFFLSIVLIGAGGLATLAVWRKFLLMKIVAVFTIGIG